MTEIMRQTESTSAMVRPTAASMVQGIMSSGITADNAAAMKDVVALFREMRADEAKEAFFHAFSKLQSELPRIVATKVIPSKDGTVRSTFAPMEEILDAITPVVSENGFCIRFDSEMDLDQRGRITAICVLSHISGHEISTRFAVLISNPPGASEAQGCGSTLSYAKRYALCNMFNIQISHDTDARMEGDYITAAQSASLQSRLRSVAGDVDKFLKVAGAKEFSKIRSGKYPMLDDMLLRKEKLSPASPDHGGSGPHAAPPSQTSGDAVPATHDASSGRDGKHAAGTNQPDATGPSGPSGSFSQTGAAAPRNAPVPDGDDPRTAKEKARDFAQDMPWSELRKYLVDCCLSKKNKAMFYAARDMVPGAKGMLATELDETTGRMVAFELKLMELEAT